MSNLVGSCSEMLQALGDLQTPFKTNFYKRHTGRFCPWEEQPLCLQTHTLLANDVATSGKGPASGHSRARSAC